MVHRRTERYILYGRRTVAEYIAKERNFDHLEAVYFIDTPALHKSLPLLEKIPEGLKQSRERRELERFFPDVNHQGIVLRFKEGRSPHENRPDWKKAIPSLRGTILALDDIHDPQNLGSMIRTSEALGVAALFLTGRGAELTPAADRVASGASFHLPIFGPINPQRLIDATRRAGYWIAAAQGSDREDSHSDETIVTRDRENTAIGVMDHSLPPEPKRKTGSSQKGKSGPLILEAAACNRLPEPDKILLFIGNEERGLGRLILEKADYIIRVPMHGQVGSLNAGTAAGILLDRIINRSI